MKKIYLTLGSKTILAKIKANQPTRPLYLLKPRDTQAKDYQLMEITTKTSVFQAPVAFDIRYESTNSAIYNLNHFMFFNFNLDEDDTYWKQIQNFVENTASPDHTSFLGIQAGSRKQYLLYTSWQDQNAFEQWELQPGFKAISDLQKRSSSEWSYYETSYTLDN
ncbi:hypothetical protein FC83_GL001109 [Agrilactobacillus composti DSM 18527 = JCM 14202]|uniref:ABM domain-containing protein n=1 Tax=Agrilactobacillus composti DSM 18527 = JCM 14202 TaxID=1423734 RepID=X0PE40_9LACO|nr:hypothetical protein [Agrilactobacillus composti]KRM31106.1 hypothetical protein FC83_GL001109 [Agrilactobacillus composti DSM 18527 = JCM 14202]GAF39508.1 hypothetical protein JCM14202_1373 [Agrilactobacillus composti DSM 18527 = JCM 14202]